MPIGGEGSLAPLATDVLRLRSMERRRFKNSLVSLLWWRLCRTGASVSSEASAMKMGEEWGFRSNKSQASALKHYG